MHSLPAVHERLSTTGSFVSYFLCVLNCFVNVIVNGYHVLILKSSDLYSSINFINLNL